VVYIVVYELLNGNDTLGVTKSVGIIARLSKGKEKEKERDGMTCSVRHVPSWCILAWRPGQLVGGLRTISICLSRNHGDHENRNFPRRGHLWTPVPSSSSIRNSSLPLATTSIRLSVSSLPAYSYTYQLNSFLLTLARAIVARLLQFRFENLASFDHTTVDQSTVLTKRAHCVLFFSRGRTTLTSPRNDDALTHRSYCFEPSIHSFKFNVYH